MDLLSATMLAELQSRSMAAYPLLEVSLPGGTKRVSHVPVASVSQGFYEPIVLRWDTLRRGVAERTCGLEDTDFSVDIDDTTREFSNLVAGASGYSIRGSAATLKIASPNVPQADWFTLFSGVLNAYEQLRPLVWTWRFTPNDLALKRPFPKTAISQADWPNAHKDARGLYPNLVYGKLSTNGEGGAVTCPLVDITGVRYMVCAGRAKAVDAVFVDGEIVTTGYSVTYASVNGRIYTLIVFTAAREDGAVVTADVRGYESVGDGSGTLIENPAEQLQHLLVNWVWGDYKTGAWLSASTAPIDTTLFATAASFLSARGHKGSRVLGGQPSAQTGLNALEEWCRSHQCQPFWRNSGQLAIRFEDPAATPYPTSTLDDDRFFRMAQLVYDARDLVDRVTVQYLYDHVAGQYTQVLEVRDLALAHELSDTMDQPWSYGSVV